MFMIRAIFDLASETVLRIDVSKTTVVQKPSPNGRQGIIVEAS